MSSISLRLFPAMCYSNRDIIKMDLLRYRNGELVRGADSHADAQLTRHTVIYDFDDYHVLF